MEKNTREKPITLAGRPPKEDKTAKSVALCNIDENQEQAAALGVRGIPALFMFKGGEVVSNRMGAAPKAALKNWIEESI